MNKETQYKRLCVALGAFSVICVIAITVMLVLWPRGENVAVSNDGDQSVTTTVNHQEGTSTTSPFVGNQDEPLTPENAISIETPYATLYLPDEWKPYVKYSTQTNGDAVSEAFIATVNNQEIPLYTIHFASPDVGFSAGTITKDGKEIPVTVELHEFEPDDTWSEENKEIFYGLQESINDVLAALF